MFHEFHTSAIVNHLHDSRSSHFRHCQPPARFKVFTLSPSVNHLPVGAVPLLVLAWLLHGLPKPSQAVNEFCHQQPQTLFNPGVFTRQQG
jgi:hypothetical protein